MSLASESNRPRRHSLAWAMGVIAVIAADLAALRPAFPWIWGGLCFLWVGCIC
jgi:hypothetical protein